MFKGKFGKYAIAFCVLGIVYNFMYSGLQNDQINILQGFSAWTNSATLAPLTAGNVVAIVMTFIYGSLFIKFGPRKVLIPCIIVSALGCVGIALANGLASVTGIELASAAAGDALAGSNYTLYAVSLFCIRITAQCFQLAGFMLASNWFIKYRGRVLGIITMGSPLFSVIGTSVMSTFIAKNLGGDYRPFYFGIAVILVLVVIILGVSKRLLFEWSKLHTLTYAQYILWCAAEGVLASLAYAGFTSYGIASGYISFAEEISFFRLFLSALWFCLLSLGVPYLIAALYYAIEDKNNTIKLMSFSSITTDEAPAPSKDERITLYDNSGSLKLVVSLANLYYIESDDNYIKVWYQDAAGVLKQYMLRCRLKTIEESFTGSGLVRCHRKYIVNFDKVETLTRVKDAYVIDLGLENSEPIPVSKTYEEGILSRFNSRT